MRFFELFLAALFALLPLQANAYVLDWKTKSQSTTIFADRTFTLRGAQLNIDFETHLRIGLLLGEPVISTRLKYFIGGSSRVTLPTFEAGGDAYETRPLSDLPDEARLLPKLYSVKVVYQLATDHVEYPTVYVHSDVGAPAKGDGKTWSFNVPESPNWNRLFYVGSGALGWNDDFFQAYKPISADDSKKILASKPRLVKTRIYRADITFYDLHAWYAKVNERPKIRALEIAINRLQRSLEISYGYPPVPEIRLGSTESNMAARGMAGATVIDVQREALAQLLAQAKILGSLPEDLKIGDNHEPYKEARRDVRRLLLEASRQKNTFQPKGADPKAFEEGYEPEFGSGVLKVKGDGLYSGERRVFGPFDYVATIGENRALTSKCSTSQVQQWTSQVRSLETGDVIKEFPGACALWYGNEYEYFILHRFIKHSNNSFEMIGIKIALLEKCGEEYRTSLRMGYVPFATNPLMPWPSLRKYHHLSKCWM